MNSFVTSIIRTYVPIVVGAFIAYLATLGVRFDEGFQAASVVVLTGVLQGAYYILARILERKFPKIGTLLLGSSTQPRYMETNK